MAKQIAVSFEDELIRVVYASTDREKIVIKKTLVLKDGEFDNFLEKEKTRRFTVVCDFKTAYQDILLLPPVKEKYLKRIVETEIRKRYPELKDFSFLHSVLNESMREGKKVKETFFLAVSNDELFKIIDRFSRYDKTVACIYPAAHALSCIVHSSIDDEPLLCVTESGMSKSLFLAVNGKPCFVRSVQSLESGMHDIDVHDINMTVNYCRQTLRLNPSKVILLGSACLKCETTMNFTLPAACIHPPPNIIAPQETVMDFIMPISALLPDEKLKSGNILPQRYRLLTLQKKVVTYCMMLLLVLSFAGLGYMKMKITEILEIKRSVDMLRDEIKQMETNRLSYEAHTRELQQFVPLINVINRANAYPDMQKALIALSALKAPYMSNAHIRSIDISAEATGFKLLLRGDVTATQYADMQRIYQELIGRIKKIKGMEVSSDRLDLKDKSFQVEARYTKR